MNRIEKIGLVVFIIFTILFIAFCKELPRWYSLILGVWAGIGLGMLIFGDGA